MKNPLLIKNKKKTNKQQKTLLKLILIILCIICFLNKIKNQYLSDKNLHDKFLFTVEPYFSHI